MIAATALVAGAADAPGAGAVKHWGISSRTPEGGLIRFDGGEAKPVSGTLWEVADFKLESFRPNGKQEVLVESPKCVVDVTKKTAFSSGPLKVSREENGLTLERVGFRYDAAEGHLVVSNRVRMVIHTTLFKEKTSDQ